MDEDELSEEEEHDDEWILVNIFFLVGFENSFSKHY
jgi:hypothetical protein